MFLRVGKIGKLGNIFNKLISSSFIKLNSGEILEQVCKMFADGYTEGNISIKVVGDTVTYNTVSTDKGDLYCIVYKDRSFYVGKRTNEDYEPKEGDWWCIQFVKAQYTYERSKTKRHKVSKPISGTHLAFYDEYTNQIFGGNKAKNTARSYYMSTISQTLGWISLHTDKVNKIDLMYPLKLEVLNCKDGCWGLSGNNTAEGHLIEDFNIDMTKLGPDLLEFKAITASDILAYKVTGHMGYLMVGNASMTHPRNDTAKFIFGSDSYPSFNSTWDFNTKYLLIVTDENGNIYNLRNVSYITFYVRLFNSSATEAQCNIKVDYINGCFVTTETLAEKLDEEYLDLKTYNYVNGYNNNTAVPTSYTVYKIPILQDNRPATLNALNTNLLNTNLTDIQPINDEQDEEG